MSGYSLDTHAEDWTPEQIEAWKADYRNPEVKRILLPHAEHEPGECDHCDLLRAWMREVDAEPDDDEDER